MYLAFQPYAKRIRDLQPINLHKIYPPGYPDGAQQYAVQNIKLQVS